MILMLVMIFMMVWVQLIRDDAWSPPQVVGLPGLGLALIYYRTVGHQLHYWWTTVLIIDHTLNAPLTWISPKSYSVGKQFSDSECEFTM